MNNENNLPIETSNKLPIEKKRQQNRMKQNLKRIGKIALNAGIALSGFAIATIGGPVATTIGGVTFLISGTNAGKNLILKKPNKESMFVTSKNLKGEISLLQDSTDFKTMQKTKGLEPQEKAALMGLEMLVGMQNYKQQFSDQDEKTQKAQDGENNVYEPIFKTITHGVNIKTIEALEKMGYLQIEEKEPKNKSILFFEKMQFGQYKQAREALVAKIKSDKENLKNVEKQMYEIKFKLTDRPLNIEEIYQSYLECKTTRGNAPLKRIGIIIEALKNQNIDIETNDLGESVIKSNSEQSFATRVQKEYESKNKSKIFRQSQQVEIDESQQIDNSKEKIVENELQKDGEEMEL